MTILFVIDSLGTGGAERHLAETLPKLRPCGVKPIIVSLRYRHEGVQADLLRQGFDVRILPQLSLARHVAAVRSILLKERPDIMQTVLFRSDLVGRLAAIGTSVKVVSRVVNTDYDRMRLLDPNVKAWKFRFVQWVDGVTARHLRHHLYANSFSVKAAALNDLRVDPEHVTVIEESRDSGRLGFPDAERKRQARAHLGLEEQQPVIVNIGRQDYQKGQCYLLEAMAQLIPTHPNLVLLVAGRCGDVTEMLWHLRERHALTKRIHFLGHREDVPEILAAADLFVFPSLYEGLPGAVIEAMALGLPVVASDIAPVRETVENGENALLVKAACPVDIASAIDRLLKDRRMALAFARRSREIFEERFTHERNMARIMGFYQHVVSQN